MFQISKLPKTAFIETKARKQHDLKSGDLWCHRAEKEEDQRLDRQTIDTIILPFKW